MSRNETVGVREDQREAHPPAERSEGDSDAWYSFFDSLRPETLQALAALLDDEPEEGRDDRELVGAVLVYLTVKDRLQDTDSGILAHFEDTLDKTAGLVDACLQ